MSSARYWSITHRLTPLSTHLSFHWTIPLRSVSNKMPMYCTVQQVSHLTEYIQPIICMYLYVICDLKLCVNRTELRNGARLSTKGETMGRFSHLGGENWLVTSVDTKNRSRIDRCSCLCLPHSCCTSRFPCVECVYWTEPKATCRP